MKTENFKHTECRNYAPVDVAKGICHRTKEIVLADGEHCEHIEKIQKCKFCSQYTASKQEFLGTCGAVISKPMTYPDLVTVTCEMFRA